MRKNIFDRIIEKKEFHKEFQRIEELLCDKSGIEVKYYDSYRKAFSFPHFMSVQDRADICIKRWKNRGTCISYKDLRQELCIDRIVMCLQPTIEDILIYSEFIANMVFICKKIKVEENEFVSSADVCKAIYDNLEVILNWINYEMVEFGKEEKILVVEKSALVSETVDLVDDNTAYKIVEYNHHSLKGDISSKKAILLKLGADLEPKRNNLTSANRKLSENIFFMLNNLNIRHNNTSEKDKNFKTYVAGLSDDELEKWYDEIYQMMLLGILELEQLERNVRIDDLKSKIC